ncbi:MAG: GNAT family N-acetyltransferase [Gammaproteobacteria bacterium]|nr:GNAT family N-acetyltransferase [Gammaproteobacteria bacterium]
MSEKISIKAFHGISGFSSLLPVWQQLLEHVPAYEFIHHPAWHHALQQWILKDQVSYVLVENDGRALAIVPLVIRKHPSLTPGHYDIHSPQHDHIALSDWILSADADMRVLTPLMPDIVSSLGVESWGKFVMEGVPDTSPVVQLHDGLHKPADGESQGFLCTQACTQYSAWFSCDEGDQPVAAKMRRNLRRLKSQAGEVGPVEMETVSDPVGLSAAFDKFLDVEACGWKGEGGSAIEQDEVLSGFYRDMLSGRFPGIRAKINLLWIGDQVAAVQYILETPSCTSILKIGYREDFGKFSPGSLLLRELLDTSLANPQTKKVSLVTSPLWAERWHPNKQAVYTCTIYNNTTRGKALRGLDGLKAIARSTYREFTER